MQGVFIVLEGPDGSGTTTHAKRLTKRLSDEGTDVFLTREPTEGPIGRMIREKLQKSDIPASSLQMLFMADRAWHVEEEILPALKAGKTVVCDRYALSTIVYGEALGLDPLFLESMNTKFIQPTHQLVLLPPFETCLERVGKRTSKDILEEDSLMKRVYDSYQKHAKRLGLTIIDSSGDVEKVAGEVYEWIEKMERK